MGRPVDLLVNSASIFPESRLEDVTSENLAQCVQVHAAAALELGRAMAGKCASGDIINFLDSRITDYDHAHLAYHLSKRMLADLTRIMALEFAPAVRVNAVAPGLILPPVGQDDSYLEKLASTNPLNRHGGPDDIVRAVLFLLGSPFVTGQTIFVDGGRHMRGRVYG
jgi:NAD(P)-dependent dehydrogenase (short-subunit alcohol dehydrogenase family)